MSAWRCPKGLMGPSVWHPRLIRFPEFPRDQDQPGPTPNASQSGRSRNFTVPLTHLLRVGGGITQTPVQLPVMGEGCVLLHSTSGGPFCQMWRRFDFSPSQPRISWTFCLFWRQQLCGRSQACLSRGTRSFRSWRVIFRFHFHMSWAHLQGSPSSCHNTCKSEVFMTLNTRGENCGLLCDSVIARQKNNKKKPPIKISLSRLFFFTHTHTYTHTYALKGS